jgi:diguanylate cyclase (GGDEF)-like protein
MAGAIQAAQACADQPEEMAVRLTQPLRVVLTGTGPALALVVALRAGALGDVGFQVALSILLLAGSGLVVARGVLRVSSRRGWLALGAALVAGMSGNALTGWAEIGLHVPDALGVALGAAAFALSILGVTFMLADRPSRLPLGAALDGMTGALVAQAVIALILLAPVKDELRDGFDVVVLLYPLGDVLLMGLVAACVAHGGWRLDFWSVSFAGLVAMTIGDSGALATSLVGEHVHGGAADMGWLVGTWLLVAAAWGPAPRRAPERWVRSAVPVVLGTAALVLLVGVAFSRHPLIPALACATGALAVVIVRLAITLHDNNRMLRLAQVEAVTDALTGLGNRRQLMADLENELERATVERPAALALFDLNGFKDYNDTYGHPAGDALLAALGMELAAAVEGVGVASRMGGDEFCVLVRADSCEHAAITERAADALSAAARGFTVTAAHGVVALPAEAANASDALRRADVRMYEHKAGGRVGSRRQVTQALMLAIEERDRALHLHGDRVQELAACIARRRGRGERDTDAVRVGGGLEAARERMHADH